MLNVSCCYFVERGFKELRTEGVRRKGLGALSMSTRVGELCVVECLGCIFVDVSLKECSMRRVRGGGGDFADMYLRNYLLGSQFPPYSNNW